MTAWWLVDAFAFGTLLVVFLLAMATGMDRGSHLNLRAWHHGYLGAALELCSLLPVWPWLQLLLRVLGRALLYDDTYQHAVQLITGNLLFRSPLHAGWRDATARWRWARQLEAWLDRRFGTSH